MSDVCVIKLLKCSTFTQAVLLYSVQHLHSGEFPESGFPVTDCEVIDMVLASSSHFCSSGFSLHMFLKLRFSASNREIVVWEKSLPYSFPIASPTSPWVNPDIYNTAMSQVGTTINNHWLIDWFKILAQEQLQALSTWVTRQWSLFPNSPTWAQMWTLMATVNQRYIDDLA